MGGHCDFHPLKRCSCEKCSGDGAKCSGKLYKTRNPHKCPFHSLVYQTQCDRRATQSNVLVGKCRTRLVEAVHLQASTIPHSIPLCLCVPLHDQVIARVEVKPATAVAITQAETPVMVSALHPHTYMHMYHVTYHLPTVTPP